MDVERTERFLLSLQEVQNTGASIWPALPLGLSERAPRIVSTLYVKVLRFVLAAFMWGKVLLELVV